VRIVVFSERLRAPYDEGIKNVAVGLAGALAASHEVLTLTSQGKDDAARGILNFNSGRLLLNWRLRGIIHAFRPDAVLYVPTSCATPFAFLRARVLRGYANQARTALLTLQPRPYNAIGKRIMRRLAPDLVLAQSRRTTRVIQGLGCRVSLLPPAVDTQRFRPVSSAEKAELRRRYGIAPEATVVTHVGHLKGKRNLGEILSLQGGENRQVVIVGSSSTEQDGALAASLYAVGAKVIDTYVARVEEIYQLSDLYLFLAVEDTAAIEAPLSVLEAMACNLPIISTPFGGLPDAFSEGRGLCYWDGRKPLADVVQTALSTPCATRALVRSHTWAAAAQTVAALLTVRPREVPAVSA